MQRVVVLRGTPASGKSTIAKSMRDLPNRIAWLKVDNFKDFFADDASNALEYVNGSAVATLKYLLSKRFSVVIDGIFQDTSAIDQIIEASEKQNIPVKVFELEVDLDELKSRDRSRPGVLGDETIERIYNNLQNNPYLNSIKLNTQEHSLEECIEIINNSWT